ncbi:ribosomal oxygenase 1-like isoform X2 [Mya arenaria]|uniref:ribosomal oxygenase 1-like isoform X2 n=1 Tax=Mya arenaria TaxID=6604 RepID=UPI0022E138B4|nr:ribosomal oxygenase 1-like isoform X2 [Mya arenaria]
MKKVSAFSILKGKKSKVDTSGLERGGTTRGSLKKASSTPVISEEHESGPKKLLRAIKGGSFRNTVRGNKHRPTILADGSGNSPFVAGNEEGVKLTSMKEKDKSGMEAANTSGVTTPALTKKTKSSTSVNRENLPPKASQSSDTPRLPHPPARNTQGSPMSTSTKAAAKQKKPVPPIPLADFTAPTPPARPDRAKSESMPVLNGTPVSGHTPGEGGSKKKKGKRALDQDSPDKSSSKKKRVSSPQKPKVQPVSPQVKVRPEKPVRGRRVWPTAVFDGVYDSVEEGRKLFECMIHPVQTDKFFSQLWQKKPLLVRRRIHDYNDGWFSTQELDRILKEEHIEFGTNLDVTSYTDGKRETLNPPGRAYRAVVWDYYQNGCSVRMLNPQTYSENVWKMLSTLQEYFGCCVGANVYLTPPGTQGFAPHYDDIEAFILQLEGKKHWRLYNPRSDEETLPSTSSGNFMDTDIGEPILDVTLEPGDLLYFPRGTIHQGNALEDAHSLHITVSCFQKNTWGDLLKKLVPRALDIAIEEDLEFRQGLPIDYLNYMGLVNSDLENNSREEFLKKVTGLMKMMVERYLPTDAACDQLGKQFIHDSLPPFLSQGEKQCSIHGHGEQWDAATNSVKGNMEMEPDSMVKLVRKGCLRLITEDDTVRIYHSMENARLYHAREPQYIEVSPELAPAVEMLIQSYPEYVTVESLPSGTLEEKVDIANVLYDKGLLTTGEPLESVHYEEDSEDENS